MVRVVVSISCLRWFRAWSQSDVPADKAKQELLALENRWLQVEDDPNALEPTLAPDFLHVVGCGDHSEG